MKHQYLRNFAASAAVVLLLPVPAQAGLSALDVWNGIRSYVESAGQAVSVGSQSSEGTSLLLRDVKVSAEMPDGTFAATIDLLEFRERSDGTVDVTMSPDVPLSVLFQPPEGESLDLTMIFRQSGLSLVASGDPDSISFDYLAARFGLELDKMFVDGEAVDLQAGVAFSDIDGRYELSKGEETRYSSTSSVAEVTYEVKLKVPEEEGSFDLSGSVSGLQTSSAMTFPSDLDLSDPGALFAAGVVLGGQASGGASSMKAAVVDGEEEFEFESSSQGGRLTFSIDNGVLRYGGGAEGVSYKVRSPQIPVPELSFDMAEVSAEMAMPMMKTEDFRDFGLALRIRELALDEMLWMMFDPGAALPRDPFSFVIGLSGKMRFLVDMADPQAVEAFQGNSPAEVESLAFDEFRLAGLGAEIGGNGSFTFDNSDTGTFGGLPAPEGGFRLELAGINGLLDRLVGMGLLPDDQAMGARMMLGLFARPAGGEDRMVSEIEVRPDGSIFANGQQLK